MKKTTVNAAAMAHKPSEKIKAARSVLPKHDGAAISHASQRAIVVDTNFLLMPLEYRIDLVSEMLRIAHGQVNVLIPTVVYNEVKMLAGKTGKRAAAARFFMNNFDKFKEKLHIKIIESDGMADRWIIKYAQKNPVYVATNDIPLRLQLLALGVPVIAMKGKSKLDFV